MLSLLLGILYTSSGSMIEDLGEIALSRSSFVQLGSSQFGSLLLSLLDVNPNLSLSEISDSEYKSQQKAEAIYNNYKEFCQEQISRLESILEESQLQIDTNKAKIEQIKPALNGKRMRKIGLESKLEECKARQEEIASQRNEYLENLRFESMQSQQLEEIKEVLSSIVNKEKTDAEYMAKDLFQNDVKLAEVSSTEAFSSLLETNKVADTEKLAKIVSSMENLKFEVSETQEDSQKLYDRVIRGYSQLEDTYTQEYQALAFVIINFENQVFEHEVEIRTLKDKTAKAEAELRSHKNWCSFQKNKFLEESSLRQEHLETILSIQASLQVE